MKCHMLHIKDLPFVGMIMPETRCVILFIKTTWNLNIWMTCKTITPSSEMVTNLSNDNFSLQTKINSHEEEIKSLKNENSNLKGDNKTQHKVVKTYQDLKIDTVKIPLLIKIRWMKIMNLTISKTKVNGKLLLLETSILILQMQEKLTLERNRKSNDIHFK